MTAEVKASSRSSPAMSAYHRTLGGVVVKVFAGLCEAVAPLSPRSSAVAPHAAAGLSKLQADFAGESLLSPIKMNLTCELARNYVFHNPRAEPTVLGGHHGRAA